MRGGQAECSYAIDAHFFLRVGGKGLVNLLLVYFEVLEPYSVESFILDAAVGEIYKQSEMPGH